MPDATRIELHALPGSRTHDLASLDPDSLVAASYLQLLTPGQWTLVPSHETDLPALKHASQRIPSSAILHHLEAIAQPSATPANAAAAADARAFHALLDQTVLPLVLHSLYSLPQNWIYVRALLAPELPFPTAFYRPNALRAAAQHTVDAAHPDWWGLGGEAEREAEEERRRKKALLETGIEGVKERKEGERREGKERMKKTFGEGKVSARTRLVCMSTGFGKLTLPTKLDHLGREAGLYCARIDTRRLFDSLLLLFFHVRIATLPLLKRRRELRPTCPRAPKQTDPSRCPPLGPALARPVPAPPDSDPRRLDQRLVPAPVGPFGPLAPNALVSRLGSDAETRVVLVALVFVGTGRDPRHLERTGRSLFRTSLLPSFRPAEVFCFLLLLLTTAKRNRHGSNEEGARLCPETVRVLCGLCGRTRRLGNRDGRVPGPVRGEVGTTPRRGRGREVVWVWERGLDPVRGGDGRRRPVRR